MKKQNVVSSVMVIEMEGDIHTPVSVYQKIQGRKKFLLESSLKHETAGRYSFLGADPVYEMIADAGEVTVRGRDLVIKKEREIFDILAEYLPDISNEMDLPFLGGAVGFLGYDTVRNIEDIGASKPDQIGMPDGHLLLFSEMIAFDHLQQKLYIIGIPLPGITEEEVRERMQARKEEIEAGSDSLPESFNLGEFHSDLSREEFERMVIQAKSYIKAGDVFQVVLSQRYQAETTGNPFSFYRKLRVQNPSPYMYYLDFGTYKIAGASPESLVQYRNNKIFTNPIAGTRPRGKSEEEDLKLEKELSSDEKELAEHRMLVDLGRNDLGKICRIGSVKVTKYMEVERYQHVMHLVSEVEGTLAEGCRPADGLLSCLPAGTVSGAPKIRAMQIINDLEPVKRGVYSGAIGYVSACGNLDFALAIRTMLIKDGTAYIQAGAGIVHDSDPGKEYDETIHKLKSLREGLG